MLAVSANIRTTMRRLPQQSSWSRYFPRGDAQPSAALQLSIEKSPVRHRQAGLFILGIG